jgi:HlyD family secretion protein
LLSTQHVVLSNLSAGAGVDPSPPIEERTVSRNAIIFIAVLMLGAGGVFYAMKHRPVDPSAGFVTATLSRGRIEAKVTATGTVSPLVNVQVGSQISGRVAALYADFNSPVKKGQVIAKLDTALLVAAVEQAKANLAAAEGALAKAKAQAVDAARVAKRDKELLDKKLIAQADFDTADANTLAAEAAVKGAEGSVEQAKASMSQARINLEYATIYSPINGVVISRSVDVGQTVAASLQAPVLFQIAEDLQKMQVDSSVAESDVGKITSGMEAVFTVDAYPNEKFKGKVRQVRNAPTNVQNVVTYDAVVDVGNPDFKLKPGMTANVSFVYADHKDVLKMPAAALRFQMPEDDKQEKKGDKSDGKKEHKHGKPGANDPRTVWVMRGTPGKPEQASVHVGISDGSFVEVIDGLDENDAVIVDTNNPDTQKPQMPGGGKGGGGGRRAF